MNKLALLLFAAFVTTPLSWAWAGTTIPLTVNLSEAVTVTGAPRVAIDVGGQARYATYTSGSGTNVLTFTLSPQAGDVDLDGITVSSPIDLNGGTMKDAVGNNAVLTFTPPNTSGIKVNYPSLGMDFVYDADGRYSLNGTIYNDLSSFLTAAGGTFSRASIGTYYDSTGTLQTAASGVPRFDWDPITHAAKGILIEESRANLITYSSQIDNANWTKNGVVVLANAVTSPDGTLSAEKVSADGVSTTNVRLRRDIAVSSAYTFSIYLKAGSHSIAALQSVNPSTAQNWIGAVFDLSSGSVTQTGYGSQSTLSFATIKNVGNGWYLCSISGTLTTYGTPAHQVLLFRFC